MSIEYSDRRVQEFYEDGKPLKNGSLSNADRLKLAAVIMSLKCSFEVKDIVNSPIVDMKGDSGNYYSEIGERWILSFRFLKSREGLSIVIGDLKERENY